MGQTVILLPYAVWRYIYLVEWHIAIVQKLWNFVTVGGILVKLLKNWFKELKNYFFASIDYLSVA